MHLKSSICSSFQAHENISINKYIYFDHWSMFLNDLNQFDSKTNGKYLTVFHFNDYLRSAALINSEFLSSRSTQ